jgi:hypothetical protein
MNERLFRAGALLAGAAIIGAAMAVNPATASDVQRIMHAAKMVNCNSSNPCSGGANKGTGAGVQGTNTGSGDGVVGLSSSSNGVYGVTTYQGSPSVWTAGVSGLDNSTSGIYNAGVYGSSTTGIGVHGASVDGPGLIGDSNAGYGVLARTYLGIPILGQFMQPGNRNPAIWAIGGTDNDPIGTSFAVTQNSEALSFWVTNDSNAHLNGLLYTNGNCNSGCDRSRGERVVSYAAQTSAPTIEDVGEGRLAAGQAHIAIDASLGRAIDRGASYVVFLTPEGYTHGLYVTDKVASGFRVVEVDGHSDISFGYRIVAKPYGVSAPRLPVVAAPRMPHAPQPAQSRLPRFR